MLGNYMVQFCVCSFIFRLHMYMYLVVFVCSLATKKALETDVCRAINGLSFLCSLYKPGSDVIHFIVHGLYFQK